MLETTIDTIPDDRVASPPPSRRFSYLNATAVERGLEKAKEYDLDIVLEEPEMSPQPKVEDPSVPVAAVVGSPREPMKIFCPTCHEYIVTKVKKKYVPSPMAWCGFGFCLLVGMWYGCCLIPFCLDDNYFIVHKCPACKTIISKTKK